VGIMMSDASPSVRRPVLALRDDLGPLLPFGLGWRPWPLHVSGRLDVLQLDQGDLDPQGPW